MSGDERLDLGVLLLVVALWFGGLIVCDAIVGFYERLRAMWDDEDRDTWPAPPTPPREPIDAQVIRHLRPRARALPPSRKEKN